MLRFYVRPVLAVVLGAALPFMAGCGKPCERLAERTCDELGSGPLCEMARYRAALKDAKQDQCEKDLASWKTTLARLKSSQAAYNQLERMIPGITRKVVDPDGGPRGRIVGPGGHAPGDGHDHGEAPKGPAGPAPGKAGSSEPQPSPAPLTPGK